MEMKSIGFVVSPARDVNGDGIVDMIIGMPSYQSYGGRVIIFGSKMLPRSIILIQNITKSDGNSNRANSRKSNSTSQGTVIMGSVYATQHGLALGGNRRFQ
jgi:hypothetical protein